MAYSRFSAYAAGNREVGAGNPYMVVTDANSAYTKLNERIVKLESILERKLTENKELYNHIEKVLDEQLKLNSEISRYKKAYKSLLSFVEDNPYRNDECVICTNKLNFKEDLHENEDENENNDEDEKRLKDLDEKLDKLEDQVKLEKLYVCAVCRNAVHLNCVEEWWKSSERSWSKIVKRCPYCKEVELVL